MKRMNFYLSNYEWRAKEKRKYDTIIVKVNVEEMFGWNNTLDIGKSVAQHIEHFDLDKKTILNKFFIENECKTETSCLVESTIDCFFRVLEANLSDTYYQKISEVYEDDESGGYFAIEAVYDNKELIVEKLTKAVYEFLGTNKEIAITKDYLQTQLFFYRLAYGC